MSRNEEFQSGQPESSGPAFVTKGNGKAVHIALTYPNGGLATQCDAWGNTGAHSSRIRRVDAAEATCKSCVKNYARKSGA